MSMVLSSSELRSLVRKSPAAEKALSVSTLVGGINFNASIFCELSKEKTDTNKYS